MSEENIMGIRILKCAHFFIVTAFADLYLLHLCARLYSFLEKDKCADIPAGPRDTLTKFFANKIILIYLEMGTISHWQGIVK